MVSLNCLLWIRSDSKIAGIDVRSHVRLKAGMQLANEIFVGCIRHFSIVLEYSTFHGRGPQAEKAEAISNLRYG